MYFSLDIIHLEGNYIIFHFWAIKKVDFVTPAIHQCPSSPSLTA